MAYYVHDISPFLVQFTEHFGLRWYGLAYVAAFLAGIYVYRWLAKKDYSELQVSQVGDFIIGAAIFGVLLGGRVGYVLFYDREHFLRDPLSFFRVWEGGMSSHGGMIGLLFYTLYYSRRHRVSWLNLGDNLVVVAPIGLFLGRVANFINGELYGRVTNVAWAMQFPAEVREGQLAPGKVEVLFARAGEINPDFQNVEQIIAPHRSPEMNRLLGEVLNPRHPSQIYEAFLEGVVLFSILWILRTRFRLPNGALTGMFFVVYGVVRIVGEFFREPDAPLTGWMTRGQFLSIFLVAIGVGFLVYAFSRPFYPPCFQKGTKFKHA